MSEVKRWEPRNTAVGYDMQPLPDGSFVLFEDFDRVTAERDRLDTRLSCVSGHVLAYKLSRQRLLGRARARELLISELQQRLTAADERVDVLETALKKINARCVAFIEAEREMPEPSVEVCQMIASAALKPAEPATDEHVCTGCGAKGWTANCSECVPY